MPCPSCWSATRRKCYRWSLSTRRWTCWVSWATSPTSTAICKASWILCRRKNEKALSFSSHGETPKKAVTFSDFLDLGVCAFVMFQFRNRFLVKFSLRILFFPLAFIYKNCALQKMASIGKKIAEQFIVLFSLA